jgi:hypothetical protein
MPDEVRSAGRENLNAVHVARCDTNEDADAPLEVDVLRRLGLTPQSIVVEVGAQCGRVIAVDASPVMLEAGFLTYGHEGDPADLVYTRYALHHLLKLLEGRRPRSAPTRALSRRRVTALGRRRQVRTCRGRRSHRSVVRNRHRRRRERLGPAELEEHVREENSAFTWLLETMMPRSGLSIDEADD